VQRVLDLFATDPEALAKACGVKLDSNVDELLTRFRAGKEREKGKVSGSASARPTYRLVGGSLTAGARHEDDALEECPACMNDVPRWKIVSCGCEHVMCCDCWKNHMAALLTEHGKNVFRRGTCPDSSCGTIIPEALWSALASDHVRSMYRKYVIHSFVPLTGQITWCPNPSCNRALRYKHLHNELQCVCGMRFCVNCQLEAHSPATCDELNMWRSDVEGLTDALTMKVLMEKYKKCPKCGVFMERTAGCNHITCKCGHQWCFMCKADWSTHGTQTGGYFKCNIYEANKG